MKFCKFRGVPPLLLAAKVAVVCLALTVMSPAALAQDPASDEGATAEADVDEAATDDAAVGEFSRELRTVEEEVKHLKERVFRSKATLQLLKELVIEGATSGSRVVVWHVHRMGRTYSVESLQYFLDGVNVFTKVDPSGSLGMLGDMKVHEQTVPPGEHNLQVRMVLRGNGFSIFKYLEAYRFEVTSSYAVKVEAGKATVVKVVAEDRGPFRNIQDRPSVRYEERNEDLRRQ